jgi:hypothetical protein
MAKSIVIYILCCIITTFFSSQFINVAIAQEENSDEAAKQDMSDTECFLFGICEKKEVKCNQSYDELKQSLNNLESDYNSLVKDINNIHAIINRDELDSAFDPCDCKAVEATRILTKIEDHNRIKKIIDALDNIHHCVFDRQNKILQGDIIDRGNFLDKYTELLNYLKKKIIKMRLIKQHQFPLYVRYFEKLSKECRSIGETLESNLRPECQKLIINTPW